jgi:two-component system phosphate regulon sensor histidine kinase PhoR
LAAIRALVETLADGAIDDESVAEDFLRRVVSEVDRLNELIEDLLDLGRLESGRLPLRRSLISVEELIGRSVERVLPQAGEARVGILIDHSDREILLNVDGSRMEQVLTNLLDNAIKFSPRGAEVFVTWEQTSDGADISVIDRGSGIAAEELPRIFERFYKSDRARNSSGTGLGLAIARHIMAAHGGELTATSVYGEGATFTARLPASAISDDPSEDRARPESRLPEY